MAERTKATVLKTVVLRTPVNEWLDPRKEAPSLEGASLVPSTPHIGKAPGAGTGGGKGMLIGRDGSPSLERSLLLRQCRMQPGTVAVDSGTSGFDV